MSTPQSPQIYEQRFDTGDDETTETIHTTRKLLPGEIRGVNNIMSDIADRDDDWTSEEISGAVRIYIQELGIYIRVTADQEFEV